MVKKILIILFFMVAVGARHAVPLRGLPLSPDTAFAATQENGQPCPPECVTDSMEIVTWYPSPYNEYEELRLYPKFSADESSCDSFDKLGLMYYNKDEQALKVCRQSPNTLIYGWEKIVLGQGGNSFSNIVPYDTPGTYTFIVPSGVTKVMVEVWGAGGGGGGDWYESGDTRIGHGGGGAGGGGMGKGIFSVTSNQTYSVVVGAGGIGGKSGKMNCGGNCAEAGFGGGTSRFGTLISATGGGGGGPGSILCGLGFGLGGFGGSSAAILNIIGDNGDDGDGECYNDRGKGGKGAFGVGDGGDGVGYRATGADQGETGENGKVIIYY